MEDNLIKKHYLLRDSSNLLIFFKKRMIKSRLAIDVDMTYSHVNKTINTQLKSIIKIERDGRCDRMELTEKGEKLKYNLIEIYNILIKLDRKRKSNEI